MSLAILKTSQNLFIEQFRPFSPIGILYKMKKPTMIHIRVCLAQHLKNCLVRRVFIKDSSCFTSFLGLLDELTQRMDSGEHVGV